MQVSTLASYFSRLIISTMLNILNGFHCNLALLKYDWHLLIMKIFRSIYFKYMKYPKSLKSIYLCILYFTQIQYIVLSNLINCFHQFIRGISDIYIVWITVNKNHTLHVLNKSYMEKSVACKRLPCVSFKNSFQ